MARTLAERTFKPNSREGLIETRSSGAPTVPIFLHYAENEMFTEYWITHSLHGKLLLHIVIPTIRHTHYYTELEIERMKDRNIMRGEKW